MTKTTKAKYRKPVAVVIGFIRGVSFRVEPKTWRGVELAKRGARAVEVYPL